MLSGVIFLRTLSKRTLQNVLHQRQIVPVHHQNHVVAVKVLPSDVVDPQVLRSRPKDGLNNSLPVAVASR